MERPPVSGSLTDRAPTDAHATCVDDQMLASALALASPGSPMGRTPGWGQSTQPGTAHDRCRWLAGQDPALDLNLTDQTPVTKTTSTTSNSGRSTHSCGPRRFRHPGPLDRLYEGEAILSNLPVTKSHDNPPNDQWARWRKPGGRSCTLVIALPLIDTTSEDCTTILRLIGHLPGLAICLEIRQEIGTEQSLVPFFVAQMPRHLQRDLQPGQRFAATLERTEDDCWNITWHQRLSTVT